MSIESAPVLAITGFFTIGLGLVILLIAYAQAKQKQFKRHRNLMLTAVIVNAAFLVQYITRFLSNEETIFNGPDTVRNYVYLPILVIHISAALVSIGMIAYHLTQSLRHERHTATRSIYFENPYRLQHRSFGRTTFYVWLSSFVGGIIIFLMLYILY